MRMSRKSWLANFFTMDFGKKVARNGHSKPSKSPLKPGRYGVVLDGRKVAVEANTKSEARAKLKAEFATGNPPRPLDRLPAGILINTVRKPSRGKVADLAAA